MARRVNTKFVIVLCTVLLVLVGGMFVVATRVLNRTAAYFESRGDALLAEGDYKRASEAYVRGIVKEPDNLELLNKYVELAREMPVANVVEARKALNTTRSAIRQAANYYRDRPEQVEMMFAFEKELADLSGGGGAYTGVHQLATTWLSDRPGDPIAQKYRGIAMTHLLSPDMPQDQIAQPEADLSAANAREPKDADVLYHLALYRLKRADMLDRRTGGDPEAAKRMRQEAYEISSAMLAQDPQDTNRIINHLTILLSPAIDQPAEAKLMVDQLEAAVLQSPEPLNRVAAAARAVILMDREEVEQGEGLPRTTRGMLRAKAIHEAALAAHPNNLGYMVMLANQLRVMGYTQQALTLFDKARQSDTSGNFIQTLGESDRKRLATYHAGDLAVQMAGTTQGEERTRWLQHATAAAASLEELVGPSTDLVLKLRGKILLREGKINPALQMLDRAAQASDNRDDETLSLIADAANRRGDWGLAASRLRAIIARRPDLSSLRVGLIDIYLQHRQLDEAAQELETLTALDPQNPEIPRLRAAHRAQNRDFGQALAFYEAQDLDQNPQYLRPLLQAYVEAGREDDARKLIAQRFDANPANLDLLRLAMAVTNDNEQRSAMIARAREAGADSQVLDLFEKQLTGSLQIEDVIALSSQRTEDPLERALSEAQLYLQANRIDDAVTAVNRAAEIAPADPRIVQFRFDLALMQSEFEKAGALADEAARQNIDLANGAFFRARLLAARGQTRAAIESMRQALAAIPVFPEGNRFLGALLRENDQAEQAIEQFELALGFQPDSVQTLLPLASAYASVGRNADAVSAMRRAYRAAPGNASVFNQYASIESAVGQPERALAARFERAERLPADRDNRRTLAIMLAEQDRYAESVAMMEELISEEGSTRTNVVARASIEQASGNPDKGLEVIQQYLATLGDQAQIEDVLVEARYLRLTGNADAMAKAYHRAIALEDKVSRPASREFADVLFQAGQSEAAVTIYRELFEASPDDPAVRLRLAETLLRVGQTQESEALLAEIEPNAVTGLLKVMAARQRGEPDTAIKLVDEALTRIKDGDSRSQSLLYYQRGEVLAVDRQDFPGAIRDLQRAIELNPTMNQARVLLANCFVASAQPEQARRQFETILQQNPDEGQVRLQLVNLYISDTDFPAARRLLDDAITRSPENPIWPQLRAQLALREQKPGEAETNWRKALALRETPAVIASLATLMLDQARPGDALNLLDSHGQSLQAQPGLQALRGRALLKTDATQAARQVFIRALERAENPQQLLQVAEQIGLAYDDPDQSIAVLESAPNIAYRQALVMALAQIEIANQRYEQALSRIDGVLPTVAPEDTEATIALSRLRGVCLYQLGQVDAAREAYEAVLALSSNDTQTLNNYAFLLLEEGRDLERAVALAEQAGRQAPANGAVLDTLGWALYKSGKLEESRLTLQRAATLSDLAASHYHLAVVLDALAKNTSDSMIRRSLASRSRTSLQTALTKAKDQDDSRYLTRAQELQEQWKTSAEEATP